MANMAKTTATATRSLSELAEEFASISDQGNIRYLQASLAFTWVGNTEGGEASRLRDEFRKEANEALKRHHEDLLSDPAVTNLVNTWKYMTRANIDTSPENKRIGDIAKAAFNLASQTFRDKEKNYVTPAIEAISHGADPVDVFNKQTTQLKKDKKADADKKAEERAIKQKEADKEITFDSLAAMLALVNVENVSKYTAEQKSTLRDLLANAAKLVK